jgi:hypothetical protein
LSVDIPRPGKTLNDQTRLEILRVLRQDGPMSYVDLLDTLKITNTGRLDFHLKVLGDLVRKDGQDGRYELLVVGAVVGAMMTRLTVSIYESSLSAGALSSSVVILIILVVAIAVLCLIYQELRYSRDMAADARGSKKG